MKKPKMKINLRISVDSTQKQRYTEEEILNEFLNCGVEIQPSGVGNKPLIIRKRDGAVMGEILKNNKCEHCGFENPN